jgi:hypothetical protein
VFQCSTGLVPILLVIVVFVHHLYSGFEEVEGVIAIVDGSWKVLF